MKEFINDKDLKKLFAANKKKVKEYKGKEGNSFLCSCNLVDIIPSLYIMKELGGGDLYIRTSDAPTAGVSEPYADLYQNVLEMDSPYLAPLLLPTQYEFIKPLLEMQPYIKSVKVYCGEDVTFNLDTYRCCYHNEKCLDKTQGIRQKALTEAWGIKVSFLKPWMEVDEARDPDRKVLVSRSVLNHGGELSYRELKPFLSANAFFYGTDLEYSLFSVACEPLWRLHATGLDDLARCVKGMEMVFSNDCLTYWLALALGVKEIHYEICPDLYNGLTDNPNVHYFLGSSEVTPEVDFSNKKMKKNV